MPNQQIPLEVARRERIAARETPSLPPTTQYDTTTTEGQVKATRQQFQQAESSYQNYQRQLFGRRQTPFLSRQQRLQLKSARGEYQSGVSSLTSEKEKFELEVAKSAPEYALPAYKTRVLAIAKSSIQDEVSRLQDKLKDAKGDTLERARIKAEINGWRDGLKGSENDVIKKYFSGYTKEYAAWKGDLKEVRTLQRIRGEASGATSATTETKPQLDLSKLPEELSFMDPKTGEIYAIQKQDFQRFYDQGFVPVQLNEPQTTTNNIPLNINLPTQSFVGPSGRKELYIPEPSTKDIGKNLVLDVLSFGESVTKNVFDVIGLSAKGYQRLATDWGFKGITIQYGDKKPTSTETPFDYIISGKPSPKVVPKYEKKILTPETIENVAEFGISTGFFLLTPAAIGYTLGTLSIGSGIKNILTGETLEQKQVGAKQIAYPLLAYSGSKFIEPLFRTRRTFAPKPKTNIKTIGAITEDEVLGTTLIKGVQKATTGARYGEEYSIIKDLFFIPRKEVVVSKATTEYGKVTTALVNEDFAVSGAVTQRLGSNIQKAFVGIQKLEGNLNEILTPASRSLLSGLSKGELKAIPKEQLEGIYSSIAATQQFARYVKTSEKLRFDTEFGQSELISALTKQRPIGKININKEGGISIPVEGYQQFNVFKKGKTGKGKIKSSISLILREGPKVEKPVIKIPKLSKRNVQVQEEKITSVFASIITPPRNIIRLKEPPATVKVVNIKQQKVEQTLSNSLVSTTQTATRTTQEFGILTIPVQESATRTVSESLTRTKTQQASLSLTKEASAQRQLELLKSEQALRQVSKSISKLKNDLISPGTPYPRTPGSPPTRITPPPLLITPPKSRRVRYQRTSKKKKRRFGVYPTAFELINTPVERKRPKRKVSGFEAFRFI